MTVERTTDEVIVHLPADMNAEQLQDILDYLAYQEATRNSQATQEQVDALVAEVKAGWWERNQQRFLK